METKPLESAKKLRSLLNFIQNQQGLKGEQQKALRKDMKKIDDIILTITKAESADDWTLIRQTVMEVKRNFGGYVGNELGQKLIWSIDALWQDVFNFYVKNANERK